MNPVYVKIDEYKDVIDIIHLIKKKIEEAKKTLGDINDLKNKEDHEMVLWHTELEDIAKRIEAISNVLEEPQEI